MNYTIQEHEKSSLKLAELNSEEIFLKTLEDGLQILGDMYYSGFDAIVMYSENIAPEFFDLKSGIAGEILQKFSNYRMRLFIVGDFENLTSKSLTDFVYESNKGNTVNFLNALEEVFNRLK